MAAKLRIFAFGADVRTDQPIHFLSYHHHLSIEIRVRRGDLREIDCRTFQETKPSRTTSQRLEQNTVLEAVSTVGAAASFLDAWSPRPSFGIVVWQLRNKMIDSEEYAVPRSTSRGEVASNGWPARMLSGGRDDRALLKRRELAAAK